MNTRIKVLFSEFLIQQAGDEWTETGAGFRSQHGSSPASWPWASSSTSPQLGFLISRKHVRMPLQWVDMQISDAVTQDM